MNWPKHIVTWWESETLNISVVFSWQLKTAIGYADAMRSKGIAVRIGGPAAKFAGIQTSEAYALPHHNLQATFTTRGCIRHCEFCAVPKIEGELVELQDWEPKPIVCDNNLLACSRAHFDIVINRLKTIKSVDFNQGLDCRLLTDHHIDRLAELSTPQIRFSWDHINEESAVMDAINRMLNAGCAKRRLHIYVLLGFHDTPDDAAYRFEAIKKIGIKPFAMRYQPLNAERKDNYVDPNWTESEMTRMTRYWTRQNWLSKIPYADFV